MNFDTSFRATVNEHKGCLTNGNRFCRYSGRLYQEHLLVIQNQQQILVGGCWFESLDPPDEPRRFICNRCAHKKLVYDAGIGMPGRVWLLLCPFCGEPLGKAGLAYRMFNVDGLTLAAFMGLPDLALLAAHLRPGEATGPSAYMTDCDQFLKFAMDAFRRADYRSTLLFSQRALHTLQDTSPHYQIARALYDRASAVSLARGERAEPYTVGEPS